MENLINIFNSQDLKYLINEPILPDDIDELELLPILDLIMLEYELLIGDRFYSNHLDDQDFVILKKAKIVAITAYQELKLLEYNDEAEIINTQWKLKLKDYAHAEKKISALIMDLKVIHLKSLCPDCGGKDPECQSCNGTGKKKEKQLSWGSMCADINMALKVNCRDATVAEYARYQNIIKNMNDKQQKK